MNFFTCFELISEICSLILVSVYYMNIIIVKLKLTFERTNFTGRRLSYMSHASADTSKTSADGRIVENAGWSASGKHNNPGTRVGVMMITGHSVSTGLI